MEYPQVAVPNWVHATRCVQRIDAIVVPRHCIQVLDKSDSAMSRRASYSWPRCRDCRGADIWQIVRRWTRPCRQCRCKRARVPNCRPFRTNIVERARTKTSLSRVYVTTVVSLLARLSSGQESSLLVSVQGSDLPSSLSVSCRLHHCRRHYHSDYYLLCLL